MCKDRCFCDKLFLFPSDTSNHPTTISMLFIKFINFTQLLYLFDQLNMPSSLPSSASIDLPPIHVHAEYRQHDSTAEPDPEQNGLSEGLTLLEGSYLKAVADVGAFEHILTTDLLNHLVFVQKVFMKVCGIESRPLANHPSTRPLDE